MYTGFSKIEDSLITAIDGYRWDKNIGKFQEGGVMPPQDPAAAQGGGDPMQEILMGCQQAVETQDCQVALQVCQVMLEMAGGAAAPAEAAPAPAPA